MNRETDCIKRRKSAEAREKQTEELENTRAIVATEQSSSATETAERRKEEREAPGREAASIEDPTWDGVGGGESDFFPK